MDKLAGAKFFSCIDLKNGYGQVEIKQSDKHKTAFSVPGVKLYEYNNMTFGLYNVPATFQRLVAYFSCQFGLFDKYTRSFHLCLIGF